MSIVHDVIKIKYVREGYLPNIPYHLVSEREMCNAFLSLGDDGNSISGYFVDNYPLLDESMKSEYDELVSCIRYHISKMIQSVEADPKMPDWVYSYMVGSCISINSDILDIHDLLVPLGVDNVDDVFTASASRECLKVSKEWLRKLPLSKLDHRPPTMFGEPHIIKQLRLKYADAYLGR